MLIIMSEPRRVLTLRDLGTAFPGTAEVPVHRSSERADAKGASPSGAGSLNVRSGVLAKLNSSRPIDVSPAPRSTLSDALARQGRVSRSSFAAPPPRLDFRAAMADASFAAVNPALGMPAPQGLIKLLAGAKRVLLIGHVFPDHDTVGANLTLARALTLLGKDVDVCIDDELSHTHRRFAAPGEIKRASELAGKSWDLAIVIDVACSGRIGDARDLLRLASAVSYIDHHREGSRDDLANRHRAKETWHDGDCDAASLQVCAITEELLAGKTLEPRIARSIYAPALAGIWTDTGGGTHASMDPTTSQYFKYIATKSGASLDNLAAQIRFDVPRALRAAIDYQSGLIKRQIHGESRRMKVLSINREGFSKLLATARAEQPHFGESDLMTVLKGELGVYQRAHGCAALVVQQESSAVVSARSTDRRAGALCSLFRGSGHEGAASATLYGFTSFDAAVADLVRKAYQNDLISRS